MKIPIDLKTGNTIQEIPQEIIVGIDLGTTNSLVAYIKDGAVLTVKSSCNQNSLTPSVVHFAKDGSIIVGEEAKTFLLTQPERTIFSAKRLMGKSYHDVAQLTSTLGYEIIDGDDESLVKIKVGERYYSPIELSALILKELKEKAEKLLNAKVTKAVITVPAFFNDSQRQATRTAGKIAGLDVLRIINEPTAASLAYGIGVERDQSSKVAVYDLGGGTFDVSILQLEDGIFEVLSTHGDTFLGGDDFDKAIVDYWIHTNGLELQKVIEDKKLNQLLRTNAEKAKIALTTIDNYVHHEQNLNLSIDLSTFEKLIKPFIDATLASCEQALKDAKIQLDELDKVILVGGSTKVPAVKKSVELFFGIKPDDTINPDEVVALGAAIQGDILAGNRKDILLLDVTPLSLGIETVGGLMDTIIARNSKVPIGAGRQYTTSVDGQTNIKISVYQGERDLVEHNRKLGEFILSGIPPMPAGLPKVEVRFILDADGILTVNAKELRSEISTSVEIKATYGISEEEMGKMLLDSIQHAQEDMKSRALLESINEANNVISASERFIHQNKAILTLDEVNMIQSLMENLKLAVISRDKDTIEDAMKSLNNYAEPLAHSAMEYHVKQALSGTKI